MSVRVLRADDRAVLDSLPLSPAMLAAGWHTSSPDPRDASPCATDCLGSGQLLAMVGRGNFATCPVCDELVPVIDGALFTHAGPDAPRQPAGRIAAPDGPSFGL